LSKNELCIIFEKALVHLFKASAGFHVLLQLTSEDAALRSCKEALLSAIELFLTRLQACLL
jgi:hypothetical protein